MWNRLLNQNSSFSIFYLKRLINVQSNLDVGRKMKFFNNNKQFKKTLELFDEHQGKNIKHCSDMIITQALKACARLGDIQCGSTIHHIISPRLKKNSYIIASIIHLYMQCSDVINAQSLFDTTTKKTLPIYGATMKGYIKNNQIDKAINLFNEIKDPDEILVILLFNACAELQTPEALNLIKKVFEEIPKLFYSNSHLLFALCNALIKCKDCSSAEMIFSKTKKSVPGYGNLINGYVKENKSEKALDLFNQMKIDGIEPNYIIYTCIIKALSQIGDYETSKLFVEQIPKDCFADDQIHNALIDMWGKTGCIDRAKEIFEKMSKPNEIGYATMINFYGLNGMGIQAVELCRQIPSILINESAHVCVLNACSHSGLVDEACLIFKNIQKKTDKIYTSMIDCLSRASFFEEAQKLINDFEQSHSPALPMYMALLSGARNEKNTYLSQKIYDRMKKLFPELTDQLASAAILLANVYGSSGEIDKATDIRIQLDKSSTKKRIGLTWTVVNGQTYQFRAHDQSHPRSDEIHAEIIVRDANRIHHFYKNGQCSCNDYF